MCDVGDARVEIGWKYRAVKVIQNNQTECNAIISMQIKCNAQP